MLLTYFVIVLNIVKNISHKKSICLLQVSNGDDAHYLNETFVRFNSEFQLSLNELASKSIISIKFQALSVECCYC